MVVSLLNAINEHKAKQSEAAIGLIVLRDVLDVPLYSNLPRSNLTSNFFIRFQTVTLETPRISAALD